MYIVYTIDEIQQVVIDLETTFEEASEQNTVVAGLAHTISRHTNLDEAYKQANQDSYETDGEYIIQISSTVKRYIDAATH